MSKSISFFAANEDLKTAVVAVEAELELQYVLAGLFNTPDVSRAGSVEALDSFGVAQQGDQAQERSYLVAPADCTVSVREVPQRRGGVKYAVDQLKNPGTVVIAPRGRFGDVAVISGQIGTAAADQSAQKFFKAFEPPRRGLPEEMVQLGRSQPRPRPAACRICCNPREALGH